VKSKIFMMVAVLTLTGSFIAPSAQAYPSHSYGHSGGHYYGHGGYGHGGYWGGNSGFYGLGLGLAAGALLTYPYYSGYSTGYDSPAYVDRGIVTVYEEGQPQVQAAPVAPSVPVWYYCQSPKGYYPYVPACPSGWQKVAATPPH
jgi:hypothetical protein